MSRVLNRKNSAIIGVAFLLVAAGAYAYWTQIGTGSDTAATGTGSAIIVNQTTNPVNLAPNSGTQPLSGNFDNPNPGTVMVASVTAALASISGGGSDGTIDACTIADYRINNAMTTTISNGGVIASGNAVGTWSGPTIEMLDRPESQDNCKGATVNITYTSN